MRILIPILLLCLIMTTPVKAQQGEYAVQLAAYDRSVPLSYFKGLSGVIHIEDHNNIHRYYLKGFSTEKLAKTSAEKAIKMGYRARVIDVEKARNSCALSCGADQPKIKPLFFDYDKFILKGESKTQLDQLFDMMIQHPDSKVELSAHTDAKGSATYNDALSLKRAEAAKAYLLAKGLPSTRIKISTFGEYLPIAKNSIRGKDLPAGRKYNRRVELIITDTGATGGVVDVIQVPAGLRI